jgi:hypothetical protein
MVSRPPRESLAVVRLKLHLPGLGDRRLYNRRLSVQTRTRVLDEEWENTFRRWYPAFRPQGQPAKKAA